VCGGEHLSAEPPSHRTLNGRDTEVRPSGADATRRARLSISFFVARNRDFDRKIALTMPWDARLMMEFTRARLTDEWWPWKECFVVLRMVWSEAYRSMQVFM